MLSISNYIPYKYLLHGTQLVPISVVIFSFLKGNTPGINNGNHDYKVQIPVGNYTAQELINAVSNSLDTVKADPVYGDTIFGSTAISYDYPSSKATVTVDITKIYNENQYILSFEGLDYTSWFKNTLYSFIFRI